MVKSIIMGFVKHRKFTWIISNAYSHECWTMLHCLQSKL